MQTRKSWDTHVKHYVRNDLFESLPESIKIQIPSSNKSRWLNEPDNKYIGCEVAAFINKEIELIKRINESRNVKAVNEAFFKLSDTFYEIIRTVKGVKKRISENKDLLVNTIENLKDVIPVEKAIRFFNVSRATYQNYKTLVLNQCEQSYFLWCTKRYPNQLLKKEVQIIKNYMQDERFKYWSKSSVYLKAVRDDVVHYGLSTWYKYCKLLGFSSGRHLQGKKTYTSLKTNKPNEMWCCDVTIFKTTNGIKYYIHFLIDHYSRMILGYKIEKRSSGIAIKSLLNEAYNKYKPNEIITLLTDGGSENVNATVSEYLNSTEVDIRHLIAQVDIKFSNSMVEAVNKVMKHQFLLPKQISSLKQLKTAVKQDVELYNEVRPQSILRGNTPRETHSGIPNDFSRFTNGFQSQKQIRLAENQKSLCNSCNK